MLFYCFLCFLHDLNVKTDSGTMAGILVTRSQDACDTGNQKLGVPKAYLR